MKIFAISDLHIDYLRIRRGLKIFEERELLKDFLKELTSKDVDVFVFAGDISAKLWEVELFLEVFRKFSGLKIFVPGNHDIWREGEITSDQKYYKILPELCKGYDFIYLPFKPLEFSNLAIIGTMGWYDYSLGDSYYSKRDFERGEYKGIRWRETYWKLVNFYNHEKVLRNEEICELIYEEFQNSLLKVEKSIEKIVITHFIPFEEILPIKNFFSAYLGSKKFGDVIVANNVGKVICGHEHKSGVFYVSNITVYKPAIGYADSIESLISKYRQNSILIEILDNHRLSMI
ncbi:MULTISPECIES: metallophosphoesterase [Dictyoglomus]|jgi:putative phosphoesterase|uniref:Metallophosphoesterase n=1 Tax=Dictyoglomus turgidum (strain DSM 6724 / Z-1310) TaxID=515635 RepID=B8DZN9_DICTD|nr:MULTISPECIES: metallophosphoesterase [Dictyoglomus]ACK41972.1 metallophosphoesterase [Dictyoglomus turgidum DSM 6724]PNV79284.1 MAG: serine/threonine protein phosphatase [Dictyoglomus turgidum]HBU31468.1 serine/threonine protein phosphatase [Dictyoglomus sp.]